MPCYKHFYTIKNTIEIKDDLAKEYIIAQGAKKKALELTSFRLILSINLSRFDQVIGNISIKNKLHRSIQISAPIK